MTGWWKGNMSLDRHPSHTWGVRTSTGLRVGGGRLVMCGVEKQVD